MAAYSEALQGNLKPDVVADRAALEAAYLEVYAYIEDVVEQRRRSLGDDLISALVAVEQEGDRLSTDECVSLVSSVIAGGTDTTQAQLAHGMRLFVEHPDQWELLSERPEFGSQAANEVLRFEPITPFTARRAREEVEARGVTFPDGAVLFVCAATANRDPSVFRDPQRFDITVVHVAPSEPHSIFIDNLRSLDEAGLINLVARYDDEHGILDVDDLATLVPDLHERHQQEEEDRQQQRELDRRGTAFARAISRHFLRPDR